MENTCEPKNCKLFDLLGGTPEQCPNYVEGWWKPLEGEPKLIKDCSPKRLMLMMQNIEIRLNAVQKTNEQQRNYTMPIIKLIRNHIEKNENVINYNNIDNEVLQVDE